MARWPSRLFPKSGPTSRLTCATPAAPTPAPWPPAPWSPASWSP